MNHKVSIIVPNYNHAQYLERRLESIFNQTFQNFEVILLDDASTDNSIEILYEYSKHPKVSHFIINEMNSESTFKQWQKGIELAKGEFIWIAESDDWADITFLETLVPQLIQDKSLILSYSQSYIIDSFDKKINISNWTDSLSVTRWKKNYSENANTELTKYMIYKCTIVNASAVIFRKNNLTNNQSFQNYSYCGDWLFWGLLLSQAGRIYFYSEPLNYFRRSQQSFSIKKNNFIHVQNKFKQYISVIKQLYRLSGYSFQLSTKHKWIAEEWCDNFYYFKYKFQYYLPPFPIKLLLIFYGLLLRKVIKKFTP